MSEPKSVASEVDQIGPGVLHWTVEDDRIGFRSDAYALSTPDGLVLIDPLPLADPALAKFGKVSAICLTVQSHQRSAWRYRKRFGAKVCAPRSAAGLEEEPDRWYGPGEALPGALQALHAPGPCEASYVFAYKEPQTGTDVLFLGDLLIRRSSGPFRFVEDAYMDEPARARESLRAIVETPSLRIDVLCSAHGPALTEGGAEALRKVLHAAKRPSPR
jgi:glyoxylase-like metal-dependent hydrolase (beta-lactamase superfamily II)